VSPGRTAALGRRSTVLRSHRRDGGVVTLEYVAILPAALAVLALGVQMVIGVDTAESTTSAVRQAARAYSLGEDPRSAAEGALSGRMRITDLTLSGPDHTVTLTVAVPTLRGLPQWTVTRKAAMP
jgi:hypothetical protein